ncbi:MAG: hypothetical protein K2Y37_14710 [Pirellulales bacterium]|nr:hypothetical protein [Pirellulales bacterium]
MTAKPLQPNCKTPHCPRPRGTLRAFCSTCWAALPERYRRELLRPGATDRERREAVAAAVKLLARTPAPRLLARA